MYVFVRLRDGDHYVSVKSSFEHTGAVPRGSMCFWCLMLSLSGPCELLYVFRFASWI